MAVAHTGSFERDKKLKILIFFENLKIFKKKSKFSFPKPIAKIGTTVELAKCNFLLCN
jgi:hypothetical protein